MSFDRPEIYSAPVLQGDSPNEDDNAEIIKSFKNFILEFRLDSQFIYRDQLRNSLLVKNYSLNVNMEHLIGYNEDLFKRLSDGPSDVIPLFETAITQVAKRITLLNRSSQNENGTANETDDLDTRNSISSALIPNFQLILTSTANQTPLRSLDSEHVSKINWKLGINACLLYTSRCV